jgi:hypothetical protein
MGFGPRPVFRTRLRHWALLVMSSQQATEHSLFVVLAFPRRNSISWAPAPFALRDAAAVVLS